MRRCVSRNHRSRRSMCAASSAIIWPAKAAIVLVWAAERKRKKVCQMAAGVGALPPERVAALAQLIEAAALWLARPLRPLLRHQSGDK